ARTGRVGFEEAGTQGVIDEVGEARRVQRDGETPAVVDRAHAVGGHLRVHVGQRFVTRAGAVDIAVQPVGAEEVFVEAVGEQLRRDQAGAERHAVHAAAVPRGGHGAADVGA